MALDSAIVRALARPWLKSFRRAARSVSGAGAPRAGSRTSTSVTHVRDSTIERRLLPADPAHRAAAFKSALKESASSAARKERENGGRRPPTDQRTRYGLGRSRFSIAQKLRS